MRIHKAIPSLSGAENSRWCTYQPLSCLRVPSLSDVQDVPIMSIPGAVAAPTQDTQASKVQQNPLK